MDFPIVLIINTEDVWFYTVLLKISFHYTVYSNKDLGECFRSFRILYKSIDIYGKNEKKKKKKTPYRLQNILNTVC